MQVGLLNAARMKAVPGDKTDVPGCGVDRAAARARAVDRLVRTATVGAAVTAADPVPVHLHEDRK